MAAADAFDVTDNRPVDRFAHDVNRHRAGQVTLAALDAFGIVGRYFLIGGKGYKTESCPQRTEVAVPSSGKCDPEEHHHQKLADQVFVRLDFREDAHISKNREAKKIQNPADSEKQCDRQEHPSHDVQNTEFPDGQLLLFPDQWNRRIKDFRGKTVEKAHGRALEPAAPKQCSDENDPAYAQIENQCYDDTGRSPCCNRSVVKCRILIQELKRSRRPRERHRIEIQFVIVNEDRRKDVHNQRRQNEAGEISLSHFGPPRGTDNLKCQKGTNHDKDRLDPILVDHPYPGNHLLNALGGSTGIPVIHPGNDYAEDNINPQNRLQELTINRRIRFHLASG